MVRVDMTLRIRYPRLSLLRTPHWEQKTNILIQRLKQSHPYQKRALYFIVAGANDRGFKYYILKEDRLLALIELDEVINRDINIDGMDEVVKSRSYSGMPTFYIWDDYSLKSALFQFHNKGWILVYLDQVNSFELIYWDDGEQKYQSLGCYKCNQDFTLSLA